jgi:dUTP pyrophosphatase
MEAKSYGSEEQVIGYLELKDKKVEYINNKLYFINNAPLGESIKRIIRNRIIRFLNLDEYIAEVTNRPVPVYYETRDDSIITPCYAKEGDSGMDVRAADDDIVLEPGKTVIVHTGIQVAIPKGYEIQVRPRSGMSSKILLRVANAPGTVDSGYRDDVGIIVWNASHENTGTFEVDAKGNPQGTYVIRKDDKIAQIVLAPVAEMSLIPVPRGKVKEIGVNRGGGFGHTGIKNKKE